jgi:hypothetical protein
MDVSSISNVSGLEVATCSVSLVFELWNWSEFLAADPSLRPG